MNAPSVRAIRPARTIDLEVAVPPSKSYTNRALIAAALADGTSTLLDPSRSDDSNYLIAALRQFGVRINDHPGGLEVEGTGGELRAPAEEIFVGNAGTAMRYLSTLAALVKGETVITGDEDMKKRTIKDLLDALHSAGVRSASKNGYPPVTIHGGTFTGGRIELDASASSQFVSSILLSAPYASRSVELRVKGKLSSLPYVYMSLHVMRSFGAEIDSIDYSLFRVNNKQRYIGHEFPIEGDASSATYFLAAAAITGGHVVIKNLSPESLQGDIRFLSLLGEMGCTVTRHESSIELRGNKLRGIDVEMNEIPDSVPTLAVVAAFAEGPTSIFDIAHLRHKETNRLISVAAELTRLGASVEEHEDGLTIHPGTLRAATIDTYNDHRMAMSFAVAGLRVKGVVITNPGCVGKSFPTFWDEFSKLEQEG
ncbi:MAG TPA: 3-phosphoshikimate 1-carboxyvinyltransferase [Bacteroidota bacterium]|jgi:3-phosphoshikimate 1-carboxyvinyltransferase